MCIKESLRAASIGVWTPRVNFTASLGIWRRSCRPGEGQRVDEKAGWTAQVTIGATTDPTENGGNADIQLNPYGIK